MVMTVATQVMVTTTVTGQWRIAHYQAFGLTELEDEQRLKFVWRRKQDGELYRPKDDMADHLLGSNADRVWDMFRDIEI